MENMINQKVSEILSALGGYFCFGPKCSLSFLEQKKKHFCEWKFLILGKIIIIRERIIINFHSRWLFFEESEKVSFVCTNFWTNPEGKDIPERQGIKWNWINTELYILFVY